MPNVTPRHPREVHVEASDLVEAGRSASLDAAHGSTDPARVLGEIHRVLRSDGPLLVVAVGVAGHERHRGTLSGFAMRAQRSLPGWRSRVRMAVHSEVLDLVANAAFRPLRDCVLAGELVVLARAVVARPAS